MLAGALVTLFFAWNGSQTFEDLEAKQSVMIYTVLRRHTHFYIKNWGVHFHDRAVCISVMAGLIVEMLFMMFSVYNMLKVS